MKWLFWKQPLDFSILYSELLTVAFYLEKICFKIQVCELQKYLVHSVILYLHCLIMLLCSNSSTTIFFLSTLMKQWAYSTINQSINESINQSINQSIDQLSDQPKDRSHSPDHRICWPWATGHNFDFHCTLWMKLLNKIWISQVLAVGANVTIFILKFLVGCLLVTKSSWRS